MGRFIARRLGISLVILLVVTFLFYLLLRAMPASFVETTAMQLSQAPGAKPYDQWVAQLNSQYGLDTGILRGYLRQLRSLITLNFGDSWKYAVPVTEKFAQTIGVSVALGAIALIIEVLVAVPLGIFAARHQNRLGDHLASFGALLGISLPTFFFATLLKLIFSVKLGWFDLGGLTGRNFPALSPWGKFLDVAGHLVLPVATLVTISAGSLLRHTRTNMLEALGADYIRTARAKGLSPGQVIRRHGFPNIRIPLVTLLGARLPGIFAGALVTETLFGLGGIGYTAYQAMVVGDIPFSMFYLSFLAVLTLLGNLLSDILYAIIDPRVTL